MAATQGSYKLVTVNSNPERASRIIGQMIDSLKDRYNIIHAANAESPEIARQVLEEIVPDVVFTASMWTPEQSAKVMEQAKEVNPKVKTLAMPQGLQTERGPQAVIDHLLEHVPTLLDG